MALPLDFLAGTDGFGEGSRRGLQKHWLLKNEREYSLHWDYIQKVNYAVQDFNSSIANKCELTREDFVFATVLASWVRDGVDKVLSCYGDEIVSAFVYPREKELLSSKKYFNAVRSFASAHPLDTNRHRDYGLDGSLICIDIRKPNRFSQLASSVTMHELTPEGLIDVETLEKCDIVLSAYRKTEDEILFCYIGIELEI